MPNKVLYRFFCHIRIFFITHIQLSISLAEIKNNYRQRILKLGNILQIFINFMKKSVFYFTHFAHNHVSTIIIVIYLFTIIYFNKDATVGSANHDQCMGTKLWNHLHLTYRRLEDTDGLQLYFASHVVRGTETHCLLFAFIPRVSLFLLDMFNCFYYIFNFRLHAQKYETAATRSFPQRDSTICKWLYKQSGINYRNPWNCCLEWIGGKDVEDNMNFLKILIKTQILLFNWLNSKLKLQETRRSYLYAYFYILDALIG